jgi:hypothetical protein
MKQPELRKAPAGPLSDLKPQALGVHLHLDYRHLVAPFTPPASAVRNRVRRPHQVMRRPNQRLNPHVNPALVGSQVVGAQHCNANLKHCAVG